MNFAGFPDRRRLPDGTAHLDLDADLRKACGSQPGICCFVACDDVKGLVEHGGQRPGFRHAVILDQDRSELLYGAGKVAPGNGRGTVDDGVQIREVLDRRAGFKKHPNHHRGQVHRRDVLDLHCLNKSFGIELRQQVNACPLPMLREFNGHAAHMEQRHHYKHLVRRLHSHRRGHRPHHLDLSALAKQHTLRPASGAAGIDHVHAVVFSRLLPKASSVCRLFQDFVFSSSFDSLAVERDHLCAASSGDGRRMLRESLLIENETGASVLCDIDDFRDGQPVVERQDNEAAKFRRGQYLDHLDTVLRQYRHPVLPLSAFRHQGVDGTDGMSQEICVAQRSNAVTQRNSLGKARGVSQVGITQNHDVSPMSRALSYRGRVPLQSTRVLSLYDPTKPTLRP